MHLRPVFLGGNGSMCPTSFRVNKFLTVGMVVGYITYVYNVGIYIIRTRWLFLGRIVNRNCFFVFIWKPQLRVFGVALDFADDRLVFWGMKTAASQWTSTQIANPVSRRASTSFGWSRQLSIGNIRPAKKPKEQQCWGTVGSSKSEWTWHNETAS